MPVYAERYSLPFVSSVLISALERKRPGLGAWSPAVRDQLRAVFDAEIEQVKKQFLEVFDDPAHWERAQRILQEVCFPRYCALAEKQTALERRDYGLWRAGDLIARGTYAAGGLIAGVLMVKLPFIPIPESWDLFAFATMLAAPFIPDAQVWWLKRRYRRGLEAVVADMREAEAHSELYRPLQPVDPTRSLESTATQSPERVRDGGNHG